MRKITVDEFFSKSCRFCRYLPTYFLLFSLINYLSVTQAHVHIVQSSTVHR